MPTSTSTRTSSNAQPPADAPVARKAGFLTRAALILLMVAGAFAMWLVVPAGLLYVVSQTQDSQQATLTPYLAVLAGIVAGMAIIGKCLGALDRYYGRRTGSEEERRRAAWLHSMRGESKSVRDDGWKVLDAILLWSLGLAAVVAGIWFFFFAGSSI